MITLLDIDSVKDKGFKKEPEYEYICMIPFSELEEKGKYLEINDKMIQECIYGKSSKFESHEGFDFIAVNVPDIHNTDALKNRICIYFREKLLVFICQEDPLILNIIQKITFGELKPESVERVLYHFFDELVSSDFLCLENFEQEISELEERLITSKQNDYSGFLDQISRFRKKLLVLKRYYEQLYNIAEMMEGNENGLINKKLLKNFRMFTNRINRLCDFVNHLRDYVTQVREAYQAQLDINSNNLMKYFTVITAIFLPLTLIAGWYGMNFQMPEYSFAYGYPVIIAVCLLVVVSLIFWFRRNRWF